MFELFFEGLALMEVGVVAAAGDELVVSTLFDDAAVLDDEDAVGVADGGNAMGDEEGGAAVHDGGEVSEDLLFGDGVDAGEGVVEDENGGVAEDGAGDGGALLLATGESDAAFADFGGVAGGEGGDVVGETALAGGLGDGFGVGAGYAEGDVFGEGGAEEEGFLRDEADGGAELGEAESTDVDAVEEDAAGGGVEQPGEEVEEGGLAGAGFADDGGGFAGRDGEGDVVEGEGIAEADGDVFERDFAANRGEGSGGSGGLDGGGRVEDFADALEAGGAALGEVDDPAEGDHGPDEHAHVGLEHDEGAERDFAGVETPAAGPHDEEEGEADEGLEQGVEDAGIAGEAEIGADVILIESFEFAELGLFLRVGADDADAVEVFLNAAGDVAELGLDELEALVDLLAEVNDDEADEGGGDEGDEGELPVDAGHDGDGEEGGEDGFDPVHDAGAEHHADLIEVVGGAGHEVAGAHGLVVGGAEQEEVGEDVVADVVLDVAGDADEDEAHEVLQDAAGEAEQNDDEGEDPEAGEVLAGKEGIEAVADEEGVDAGENDFAEEAGEADGQAAAVAAEVRPGDADGVAHQRLNQ